MSRIRFAALADLTRGHANITSKAITTFRHRRKDLGARKSFVARCEVCENEYDKAFELTVAGKRHTFDSFECAIHQLAPVCDHCGCKVIGHGIEANKTFYCCANCARESGVTQVKDRA